MIACTKEIHRKDGGTVLEKANNGNGNIQKRFARTIDELTRRKGSYGLSRFAERLERVKGGLEDTRIKPMSLFLDVVDVIRVLLEISFSISTIMTISHMNWYMRSILIKKL